MLVKCAIVFRCYSALQTLSVKNFSWVYYWQVNVLQCREVSNILLSCYFFYAGIEVQSDRLWAFMCASMAYNGTFCKYWWMDCRHACE